MEILYPSDYLPTPNAAQTSLIDKFVTGLENALHVKRTKISLAEMWKHDSPDGLEHADIAEYLKTVRSNRLVCHHSANITGWNLSFLS